MERVGIFFKNLELYPPPPPPTIRESSRLIKDSVENIFHGILEIISGKGFW